MATSPVQFQFGSVVLSNVVGQYSESPYTDPSGTDVAGIRQTIKARGTLARGLPPTESGESTSDTLARLRTALMRHRRYFVWAPFGTVVVEVGDRNSPDDPDVNLDIANGPRCTGLTVLSIAEGCIEVEISVDVTTLACTDDAGRAVLTHRWRQQEDYDRRGYCTLTTAGTILLRADKVLMPGPGGKYKKTVDLLEEAGVLATREGYQLVEPIQHGYDETGLILTYVRTDKEFEVRPPDEAFDCEGEVSLLTPGNNVAAHAIISVSLKGNKGVERQKLLELAIRIITATAIRFRFEQDGTASPVVQTRHRSGMYDNKIEVQMIVIADPKKYNTANGRFQTSIFSFVPSGSFARGTADGLTPVVPPLGEEQRADLIRPGYKEPCDAIVEREIVGSYNPLKSGLAPAVGGQLGVLAATPGPAAGGGGAAADPGTLTPAQIEAIGGFLRGVVPVGPVGPGGGSGGIAGGAIPVGPVVGGGAAVLQSFATFDDTAGGAVTPPGGVTGQLVNNEFGAFGSNDVQNRRQSVAADPIDFDTPYTVYLISMTTSYDSGRRVVPGCGPRDPKTGKLPKSPVARVHNGHAKIMVTWSATRSGRPPQIPDPFPADENFVLTTLDIGVDELERHPEGHYKYRRTGVYGYELRSVEETKIFDIIPPMILREVQASAPGGLGTDQPSMAKDILWWSMRKAAPNPIFRGPEPVADRLPAPSAPVPAPAPSEGLAGLLGVLAPDAGAGGGLPAYDPNPGG